jgi:hypothetical protein
MTLKTNTKILFVNFVEVNLKKKFYPHLERVSQFLASRVSGTASVTGRGITWIRQKLREE